jgi:hypothetical protein
MTALFYRYSKAFELHENGSLLVVFPTKIGMAFHGRAAQGKQ